ncbi:class I SAM-dependent methyltransferase [Acidimangrovimonas sediminis]|uniref:class I SAM-dependent methyltransferase n=1 Tax=Acidimangrovimonas sediminis TaxID=2056283 RepID=UPI000C80BBD2|nr:class I SAM-dependent methyltransferase [Acidimangrovimonas sediminis]
MSAFLTLYGGLDREGPGDRESLDWALGVAKLAPDARVLDAGCGSGADLAGLRAWVPAGAVLGLDKHAALVDRAARRCPGDPGVMVRLGDMAAPGGEFGLIWSAGALYFLGVEAGLRRWRDRLAPGGKVAFSELAWRHRAVPETPRTFWAEAYPAMTDTAGIVGATEAAGFRVIASRWLPSAAWCAYYDPLAARCDALEQGGDPDLAAAIAQARAEIALWRLHGGSYGYLQVVAEEGAA